MLELKELIEEVKEESEKISNQEISKPKEEKNTGHYMTE